MMPPLPGGPPNPFRPSRPFDPSHPLEFPLPPGLRGHLGLGLTSDTFLAAHGQHAEHERLAKNRRIVEVTKGPQEVA